MTLAEQINKLITPAVNRFVAKMQELISTPPEELKRILLTVTQKEVVLSVPAHSKPAIGENEMVRIQNINGIPRFVHSGFVWDKKTASVTGYVENTPNGLRISSLTEEKLREAAFLDYQVRQDLYLSDEQAKALIEPREEKKVIQPPVIPSITTEGSSTPSKTPVVTLPVALPVLEGVAVEMLEPEEIEGVEV